MRRDLKKILFLGSTSARSEFFERAQKLGKFQFFSSSEKTNHVFPKKLEDLRLAITVLHRQTVAKPVMVDFSQGPTIVDRVLVLKREIENLHEEIRLLEAERLKMLPLGEFDMEELDRFSKETGWYVQFFMTRHGRVHHDMLPKELIFVNREYDFDYFMYVGKERFYQKDFSEITIKMSLGRLKNELAHLQELSHKSEVELRELACYADFLHDFLLREMNLVNLHFVKGDVSYHLDDDVFSIEAWVPENEFESVRAAVSDLPVYYAEVAIEDGDPIPTLLENTGIARIGQDLVEGFDSPSVTDADPSSWVVWSFALFFAMIVADACYGMIFLVLSAILWTRAVNWTGVKRRMAKLLTLLACTTVIWGVMVGSYFSIKLPPDHVLNRISFLHHLAVHKISYHLHENDDNLKEWIRVYPNIRGESDPESILRKGAIVKEGELQYELMSSIYDGLLLEIAILVGVVHLSFSFLRNLRRNWAGVGWIASLWGGYFFFPKMLDATTLIYYMGWLSQTTACIVGEQLLYGGIIAAIILSIVQTGFAGFAAVFKIVEVFADTLSYLRLYALGLASMVLAGTFNEIGTMVGGYVFGAIVVVLGHTINIGLGVGAGVIHGLRLNFLEWYHHSFEGDGKKFNPLRLLVRGE